MLNNLWGKIAQRENMTETEYISEPSKYFESIEDREGCRHLRRTICSCELGRYRITRSTTYLQHCGRDIICNSSSQIETLCSTGKNERTCSLLRQTLSFMNTNQSYGTQQSETDLENGPMKYPMAESCYLLGWGQRIMVMSMWTKASRENLLVKSKIWHWTTTLHSWSIFIRCWSGSSQNLEFFKKLWITTGSENIKTEERLLRNNQRITDSHKTNMWSYPTDMIINSKENKKTEVSGCVNTKCNVKDCL